MLVCKHFAFVHMTKTGGTWVKDILNRHAPKEWGLEEIGRPHAPASEAPSGIPSFAFVRNPWDWYVSQYFFHRRHWEDGTGGYILPRPQWQPHEEHFALMFEASRPGDGFDIHAPRLIRGKEFIHSQVSRAFERIIGFHNSTTSVFMYENLRTSLLSFLEKTTGMVPQGLREAILKESPTNTSRHKGYREYYSEEVRDLVAKHDARLIERFGYEF